MLRRRAATAAHDSHAELLHELAQHSRHRQRLERINRLTRSGVQRQAGVGNDRDGHRRMLRHEPNRLAHVFRAGRAVQPDHVHAHRFQRRHCTRDVGAEQHATAGVERDLRLHRNPMAEFREQPLEAGERRLHLENILRCLHEQHIHAALHEVLRLPVVRLGKRLEGDIAERRIAAGREHARGSDGPRDEPWPLRRGVLVAGRAREASGLHVQRAGFVLEPPLAQAMRRALKRARLHDVAADGQKGLVDRLDDVGPGEHEVVIAAL